MDLAGLQTDPALPTGRVRVSLEDNEPSFDIVHPAAFDAIEGSSGEAGAPALLYHGTLAARADVSRKSLQRLRASRPGLVFVDVNLRPPWWQRETARAWLRGTHWVKLSGDELRQLEPGIEAGRKTPEEVLDNLGLDGMVLTHGERGAEALVAGRGRWSVEPGPGTTVVDTVGAGDAFAAVMILGLVRDWPTAIALQRAQVFASALCGRRGATVPDPDFYRARGEAWDSG
jgi:fructokinase